MVKSELISMTLNQFSRSMLHQKQIYAKIACATSLKLLDGFQQNLQRYNMEPW